LSRGEVAWTRREKGRPDHFTEYATDHARYTRDQLDDAENDQSCSSLPATSSGILPSKRDCTDADEGTEHARPERIHLMNMHILAEKQLEMETQGQVTGRETDLLVQCGCSADEIVALLWLRQWYQTGGSDRFQIVRHLEFLQFLVSRGRMAV
jgi:hypothetical protein